MARTDRDDDRWRRRNHHRNECPNAWRSREWTRLPQSCLFCDTEPAPYYWCSTDGKGSWNRDERQTERARAKHALRACRDWDNLSIKYRRPWWD